MRIKSTPVTPLPTPTAWDLKLLERYDNGVRLRALLELGIVRHLVNTLIAAGYLITVDDGEDRPVKRSKDVDLIMDHAFSVDECHLIVHGPDTVEGQQSGAIFLVFGNSGHDVMADWSASLEEVIKPTNDYADTLEGWL